MLRSLALAWLSLAWLSLAVPGCTQRSLSAGNTDGGVVTKGDLASGPGDLGDFFGHDLATSGPDLASSSAGVSCGGGIVCSDGLGCCITGDTPTCVTVPQGGGNQDSQCMGGLVLACDGPEDCPNGRVCSARVSQDGTLTGTRCRMPDPDAFVLCHTDADCDPGVRCSPVGTTSPNDPSIGVCGASG